MPRSVLIFGNPGAGKSTFLNVLVGGPRFRSGLGEGRGLTQELSRVVHDGVTYFDVPGLADIDPNLRKGAAEAMTRALQQAGDECAVFFVLTLEAGRIKPDDVVTIRATLLASLDISSYGVIVNKASPRVLQRVEESPGTWMDMAMEIIPPGRRTTHFHYQKNLAAFEDQEGSSIDFGAHAAEFADLRRFILSGVQPCSIRPDGVTPVDPASFEQLRGSYDTLKQETARLVRAIEEREAEARANAERAEALRRENARLAERARQTEAAFRESVERHRREAREAWERLQREQQERARREREERARREREERERREQEQRERREREERERREALRRAVFQGLVHLMLVVQPGRSQSWPWGAPPPRMASAGPFGGGDFNDERGFHDAAHAALMRAMTESILRDSSAAAEPR